MYEKEDKVPWQKTGVGYFFKGKVFLEIGCILEEDKPFAPIHGQQQNKPSYTVYQYREDGRTKYMRGGSYGTIGDWEFEFLPGEDTPENRLFYILKNADRTR